MQDTEDGQASEGEQLFNVQGISRDRAEKAGHEGQDLEKGDQTAERLVHRQRERPPGRKQTDRTAIPDLYPVPNTEKIKTR